MSEKDVKDINSMVDGQYEFHYFANDMLGIRLTESLMKSKKYTREQIRKMYQNPFASADKLIDASIYFYQTSGHYQRMIDYLANMLTFDHVIYPSNISKIETIDIKKQYEKTAMELSKFNIKMNMRKFTRNMLLKGVCYYYKMQDKTMVMYKELPHSICQAYAVDNGVLRYKVDLSKLTKTTVTEMPIQIQLAWKKYMADKKDRKKKVTNKWLELGEEGVAFNMIGAYSIGFPIMMYMFDSLLAYDETMDLYEDQVKLDSLKLIHQRVPLDKDNLPILKHDVIRKYHTSTKNALPKTVSIATNPLELQAVNFDKSALRLKDGVVLSEDHLYSQGGISKLLFNNVTNSGEGLKKSMNVDEMMVFPLLEIFKDYINSELRSTSKTNAFRIKFLDLTFNNRPELRKIYREDLTYGGSRTLYMASQGLEPIEMLGILKTERALDLDELFVPLATSHTMSADEAESGGQEKDEVTDEGDQTRQRQ